MKISIKKKLFFILLSITLGYICSIFILNFTILEDYYISKVNKRMEVAADDIKEHIDGNGVFNVGQYIKKEYNAIVKTIIMKKDGNTVIYNSVVPFSGNIEENENAAYNNARSFMLDNIQNFNESLKVNTVDFPIVDDKVLQLMNKFDKSGDTYYVCLMTSFQQIEQNISIFNRFCLMFGIIIMVVFGAVSVIIIEKITHPFICISNVTKKLAKLDFSDRLDNKRKDELGTVAENINVMADKLESTLNELITINQKQAEDISYKDRVDNARKYFLSSVSHELKTPISLIVGYAEAIKFKDKKTPVDSYCDIIIDEGNKMNKLVGNILRVAQMDSGIIPINKVRFSITELIGNYIENSKILLKENHIDIESNFNSTEYVYADYELIYQVINNYMSNAINHTGGKRQIRVFTFDNKDKVRVSVFNTGKHIQEENLSKVWENFFKEDKARTREYGGHGFGLTIVKSVMTRHGTAYGVNNVEDGVTFYFEVEKDPNQEKDIDKTKEN